MSEKLPVWDPLKGVAGGVLLVILAFFVSRQYLGLGLETIQFAIEGSKVFVLAFLFKMIFTSITLNFGGSGGIVTPIFFIGAASGNFFGRIFGLDLSLFSAIGMVSLLAGAANTPISASIMAVELFGPAVGPYAAVACVISFLMTGHRSVYPSQVLAIAKSSSIAVEKGREMEDIVDVDLALRSRSIIGSIARVLEKLRRK